MKWPAHRTPRYIGNRLREWLWQQLHPNAPWLSPKAVKTLKTLLKPHLCGLEFGAGRSTLWVASRVAQLHSWEEHPYWYGRVQKQLAGASHVRIWQVVPEGEDWEEAYAAVLESLAGQTVDFALVDAAHGRQNLCLGLVRHIAPGGFIMLDNANWFLPSSSHSPNSRNYKQGAATAGWQQFLNAVADWECIWTSSGVTDTAFFVKNEEL